MLLLQYGGAAKFIYKALLGMHPSCTEVHCMSDLSNIPGEYARPSNIQARRHLSKSHIHHQHSLCKLVRVCQISFSRQRR